MKQNCTKQLPKMPNEVRLERVRFGGRHAGAAHRKKTDYNRNEKHKKIGVSDLFSFLRALMYTGAGLWFMRFLSDYDGSGVWRHL
jgi:hypothetical protein